MLFLNCMHVWRNLETEMFSGNIKTSKYSVKVKETKNFEQKVQCMWYLLQHSLILRENEVDMYTNLKTIPERKNIRLCFTTYLNDFWYMFTCISVWIHKSNGNSMISHRDGNERFQFLWALQPPLCYCRRNLFVYVSRIAVLLGGIE